MKAIDITLKSTECRNYPEYHDGITYRVLLSDIPEYVKEEWMKEADGICTDKELENPLLEMEAVLLPDGKVVDTEFKYYFDDYVEFELNDEDVKEACELFTTFCKENGSKYPDAYNKETGETIGDGEWEELVADMEI